MGIDWNEQAFEEKDDQTGIFYLHFLWQGEISEM